MVSSLVTVTVYHPAEKEKIKGKKENQFHREKNRKIGQISRPDSALVLPWREFL